MACHFVKSVVRLLDISFLPLVVRLLSVPPKTKNEGETRHRNEMPLERSIEMHCLSSTALDSIHAMCIFFLLLFLLLFVVHVFVI